MNKKRSETIDNNGCQIKVIHKERVFKAQEKMLNDHKLQSLGSVFKVMGDTTRLKMIMALIHGEMCVCDLAAFLGVSESAVSHQLVKLRNLSLVKTRRDGPILYYSLIDKHIETLINIGLEHVNETNEK